MSRKIESELIPYNINFVRVALNKDQIASYGLDHLRNPDPSVKKKLEGEDDKKGDPNKDRFMEENDGELFQIELDAVQKDPQQFKELVVDTIDSYYDEGIHEKNLKEFTPRKITALINKRIKFLGVK